MRECPETSEKEMESGVTRGMRRSIVHMQKVLDTWPLDSQCIVQVSQDLDEECCVDRAVPEVLPVDESLGIKEADQHSFSNT